MVTHGAAIAQKAPRLATLRKGGITVKQNAARVCNGVPPTA